LEHKYEHESYLKLIVFV